MTKIAQILPTLLLIPAINSIADDYAYKNLPSVAGTDSSVMYFESGPAKGCPTSTPDSDTQNFWEGGRITQGDKLTRFCWFAKGEMGSNPQIVVLDMSNGKTTIYSKSELTLYPQKQPAYPPQGSQNSNSTNQSNAHPNAKDPDRNLSPNGRKQKYCIFLAGDYESATTYRNMGASPKDAYGALWQQTTQSSVKYYLTEKTVKKIVNDAYFNPDFTYAGGAALRNQVYNSCMGIHSDWQPIK